MAKPVILCVDDERSVLVGLKQELEHALERRYDLEIAESAEEALSVIESLIEEGVAIPVVISDQLMPGMKGDELLVRLAERLPETRKILLTGQASADAVGNALNRARLYRFISKPWEPKDLQLTVRQAAESYFQDIELKARLGMLQRLNGALGTLGGVSQPDALAQAFLQQVVADTRAARGLLITYKLGKPALTLECEAQEVQTLPPLHDWQSRYPARLIQSLRPDSAPLNMGEALLDDQGLRDPYVKQSGLNSCYMAPLARQGQLLALLYLEEPRLVNHFLGTQAEYLDLLLRQSAIYFDNALLRERMEEKIEERTRAAEEKNEDLNDSLRYASRIQQAFQPTTESLQARFPGSFVLYEPRDSVSGDLLWLHHLDDGSTYLALTDAAGHAVPAALLSVLGCVLLNRMVPSALQHTGLDVMMARLNETISSCLAGLEPEGADVFMNTAQGLAPSTQAEYMNMALARLAPGPNGLELTYVGANLPAWLADNGTQRVLPAEERPLGQYLDAADAYPQQSYTFTAGGMLFLFNEGLLQQLGGPGGHTPAGMEQAQQWLTATAARPPAEQRTFLVQQISAWRGNHPPSDDVLVMGLAVAPLN